MIVNPETGRPEWSTGSEFCLPDIPVNTNTEETNIYVQDEGCFKSWKPDYDVAPQQVIIADASTETLKFGVFNDLLPSGCGVLTKDCGGATEGDVSFQGGTAGQALVLDSDLNPRFSSLTNLGLGVGFQSIAANNTSASVVTIQSAKIIIFDASGNSFRVSNVNVTANITVSGAGGLDNGSEASSTWYYYYVIYNPTTLTTSGLLSTSSGTPVLPTDYTFYRMIGAVRNNGSSNFVDFYQYGNEVWQADQTVFNSQAGSLTYVSQSLTAYVPPIAVSAKGIFGTNAGTGGDYGMIVAGSSTGFGKTQFGADGNSGSTLEGWFSAFNFTVPMISSQTIYYVVDDTSAVFRMNIIGYTLNL